MLSDLKELLATNVELSDTIVVKIGTKKVVEANFTRLSLNPQTRTATLEYTAIEAPKVMQANGTRKAVKGGSK